MRHEIDKCIVGVQSSTYTGLISLHIRESNHFFDSHLIKV